MRNGMQKGLLVYVINQQIFSEHLVCAYQKHRVQNCGRLEKVKDMVLGLQINACVLSGIKD